MSSLQTKNINCETKNVDNKNGENFQLYTQVCKTSGHEN